MLGRVKRGKRNVLLGTKHMFIANGASPSFLVESLIPKGFQLVAGDKRSAIPGS